MIITSTVNGRILGFSKIKRASIVVVALTCASALEVAWAADECGPGPVVTCTGAKPTGVTYTSPVDFSLTTSGSINAGTNGFDIVSTGEAHIAFTQSGAITGAGGVDLASQAGDITMTSIGNFSLPGGLRAKTTDGDVNIMFVSPGVLSVNSVSVDTSAGAGNTIMNLSRSVGNLSIFNGSGNYQIDLIDNTQGVRVSQLTASGSGLGAINVGNNTEVTVLSLSPSDEAMVNVRNSGHIGSGDTGLWAQGSGSGDITVVSDGRIRGRVDFAAATGAITIVTNSDRPLGNPANGGWWFAGASVLGSGDDLITNGPRGVMASGSLSSSSASIDFGAGDNRFINNGRLIIGRTNSGSNAGLLTLSNLTTFENNGLILMGAVYGGSLDFAKTSDLAPGNRLVAEGVNFVAGAGSRVLLDAALADTPQPDCSVALAADCLDFSGGATSGTTVLTLFDARPAVSSAAFNEGMVLIEGASAAEHFVLDPNSSGYVANTSTGPAIQKGLVTYRFTYDETAKQHKLTGVLADEGAQGGTFMASAQEIWRTTTDTWFDRQAALRARPDQAGSESGLWSTVNLSTGERDFVAANVIGGNSYDYNLRQDQQITHLAFGGDFVNDGGLSFGGMAGYVYSTIDYDATKLQSEIGGFQAGLYGSYLSGPLSVDALVNYNLARQSLDAKNLGLGPDTRVRTEFTSIGGRVDAGYRLSFGEAFYLQPLLGAAYVTTTIDDLELPSNGGSFEFDGTSLRAGVGLRMGLVLPTGGLKTSFDLTGRWWNEMDGENETVVTIPNGNTEVPLTDEFDGGFSEVAAGIQLAGPDSVGFSGFINVKSKFASEYRTLGASAGFRYQW
jgi:hypothetical protein